MDIHTIQGIFTGLMMVAFLAVVWWAFSKQTKKRFSEAANLPFADEALDLQSRKKEGNHE